MIEHHKQSKESSEIAMISMDYNKLCYLNELWKDNIEYA